MIPIHRDRKLNGGVFMLQRELLYAALGTGFTCLATVLGAAMVFFFKK